MKNKAIYDGFNNWKDVVDSYGSDTPQPEEVLVAAYSYEDYSGSSWVVYRNGEKYYMVEGGHCSCHGLEGQWDAEEFDNAKSFLEYLEKMKYSYGISAKYLSTIIEQLKQRI